MTRWTGLGLLACLLGCPMTSPAPSPPGPSPLASPAARAIRLEGSWTLGAEGEPEPSPSAYLGCRNTLRLSQEGDRLDLTANVYCGAASDSGTGTLQGNRLRMEGQHLRGRQSSPFVLDLTYHPETGHLTGTRNGAPVWLVPHGSCPSPAIMCSVEQVVGDLYDEGGKLIGDVAKVTLESLNPSYPYKSTVSSVGGHYVMRNVPPGVELEVTVEVAGQAKVSRRLTVERGPIWEVNFGGPKDAADPDGWRYWVKP